MNFFGCVLKIDIALGMSITALGVGSSKGAAIFFSFGKERMKDEEDLAAWHEYKFNLWGVLDPNGEPLLINEDQVVTIECTADGIYIILFDGVPMFTFTR